MLKILSDYIFKYFQTHKNEINALKFTYLINIAHFFTYDEATQRMYWDQVFDNYTTLFGNTLTNQLNINPKSFYEWITGSNLKSILINM